MLPLASQLSKIQPSLRSLLEQPEADADDDEEVFVDAKDSDSDEEPDVVTPMADSDGEDGDDAEDAEDAEDDGPAKKRPKPAGAPPKKPGYDMRKRDPQFTGAEHSCMWEICELSQHYHPSVEAWAKMLTAGVPIKYKGDPLRDFTPMRFLERFVFKKPKTKKTNHGGSLMQRHQIGDGGEAAPTVNEPEFASRNRADVPVEEQFFHQYFTQRASRSKVEGAEADAAGQAAAVGADVDFSGAFGMEVSLDDDGALGGDSDDDFDSDGDGAPIFSEDDDGGSDADADGGGGGKFDPDDFEESDPEEDLDLEAIAREGFGEDEEADDYDPADEGESVFASAEDFAHMLEEEDTGAEKERKRDMRGDLATFKPGQKKGPPKRGPGRGRGRR